MWEALGLRREIVSEVIPASWTAPTPIQQRAIPPAVAGRDIIGLAETGAGKTGAFALPIIDGLLGAPSKLHALVLAPTRELASQLHDDIRALGAPIGALPGL